MERISQITPASDVVEDIKKQIEDETKNKQEDQESKELNAIMDKHSKALNDTFKEIMDGDMDE